MRVFLRNELGLDGGGGAGSRSFGRAAPAPIAPPTRPERWRDALHRIDWVPDLGVDLGSRTWWRGLLTCLALCVATWPLRPDLGALAAPAPAALTGDELDEARAQGIAPLAWGAGTGRRMAASDLVRPLADAPERPSIDESATVGQGDAFGRVLARAGVGAADVAAASDLLRQATALGDIAPGTRIALTLGRRPSKLVARPLARLELRARFDLAVTLVRAGAGLAMQRHPIAIDRTPLRVEGLVGASLYRSARAAGVPAGIVETYIRALATKVSIGRDVGAADRFDLVIDRERAATGETRLGGLQLARIAGAHPLTLVRWENDGATQWWDANGENERRGELGMPVAGHITSGFGLRFHPILGFNRMHKGIDIGAPWGTPVYAVADGRVLSAGWSGGYGNFVRLAHSPTLATGYGHLSRIAVRAGEQVRRGEVIAYVGSTGMSTGPHLHWEVWRNGQAVNPMGVSLDSVARLAGEELRRFKARVAALLAAKAGG